MIKKRRTLELFNYIRRKYSKQKSTSNLAPTNSILGFRKFSREIWNISSTKWHRKLTILCSNDYTSIVNWLLNPKVSYFIFFPIRFCAFLRKSSEWIKKLFFILSVYFPTFKLEWMNDLLIFLGEEKIQ